jgi:hypothetical protein
MPNEFATVIKNCLSLSEKFESISWIHLLRYLLHLVTTHSRCIADKFKVPKEEIGTALFIVELALQSDSSRSLLFLSCYKSILESSVKVHEDSIECTCWMSDFVLILTIASASDSLKLQVVWICLIFVLTSTGVGNNDQFGDISVVLSKRVHVWT